MYIKCGCHGGHFLKIMKDAKVTLFLTLMYSICKAKCPRHSVQVYTTNILYIFTWKSFVSCFYSTFTFKKNKPKRGGVVGTSDRSVKSGPRPPRGLTSCFPPALLTQRQVAAADLATPRSGHAHSYNTAAPPRPPPPPVTRAALEGSGARPQTLPAALPPQLGGGGIQLRRCAIFIWGVWSCEVNESMRAAYTRVNVLGARVNMTYRTLLRWMVYDVLFSSALYSKIKHGIIQQYIIYRINLITIWKGERHWMVCVCQGVCVLILQFKGRLIFFQILLLFINNYTHSSLFQSL